jgi:hypothetical protein
MPTDRHAQQPVFYLDTTDFNIYCPLLQVALSVRVLKGKTSLNLLFVDFIALIIGGILPVCATMISLLGFPSALKCADGCFAFVILGWMITAVFIPIIGLVVYIIYRKKHKVRLR